MHLRFAPNIYILYVCITVPILLLKGCFGQDDYSYGNDEDQQEMSADPTRDILETLSAIPDPTNIDFSVPDDNIPQVAGWIDDCKKTVDGRTWRVIRNSPNRILDCISKYIKLDKLRVEVNDSMAKGDLDVVFKKYCGRREPIMSCIDDVLETIKPCLNDQQLIDLNITRRAIDAGIDFTCYKNGDRIAMFMAEAGVECLRNNSEIIKDCIYSKLPEVEKAENDIESVTLDKFVIDDRNCKKLSVAHECVVTATTSCSDPTPSNILDSLITQILKVTPCADMKSSVQNASTSFSLHVWAFLPEILTLIFAGLTAAHILL